MAKIKQVQFNVKNLKYALASEPETIKELAYISKLSLQKQVNSDLVRGDGQVIIELLSDQGLTGSLTLVQYPEEFLKDLGFLMEVDGGGLAEVAVNTTENCHIYVEIEEISNTSEKKTIKMWLYNVVAQKPDLSHDQNEDNPVYATYEIPLTIFGVNLKNFAGTSDEVDLNGNTKKVWRKYVKPGNEDYVNFGSSLVFPKVKAIK